MSPGEAVVLGVHVLAGFVALFAGLVAIATKKGGRRHRRGGRIYLYSMAVVSGTALLLLAFEQSFARQFLALIAVFSFYFAFSGYRVLSRKRPTDGATVVDWAAVVIFAVASLAILVFGGRLWLASDGLAPVLLVFGAIGAAFSGGDFLSFAGRRDGGTWLAGHVARMGGGYIATVTAFSTVNFAFLPVAARWLWPTAVGVPAIYWAIRHYEAEFGLA